jgi:hypothetical protein
VRVPTGRLPPPAEVGRTAPPARVLWHDRGMTTTTPAAYEPTIRESPNRAAALTIGTIVLLVGACGFFAEDMGSFFDTTGAELGFLNVNPALIVIWVLSGAALLIAGASGRGSARTINAAVGLLFVVLGVAGFLVRDTDANVLALNLGDDVVHLGAGAVLLLTAIGAERRRRR